MSEYELLERSFQSAFARQEEYERAGLSFAGQLVATIIKVLECPAEKVQVRPPGGDGEESKDYGVIGALRLEEDSYFRMRIVLQVGARGTLTWRVRFKRPEDAWLVGIGNEYRDDTVTTPDDLASLVRKWAVRTRENLDFRLAIFLSGKGWSREIGFKK